MKDSVLDQYTRNLSIYLHVNTIFKKYETFCQFIINIDKCMTMSRTLPLQEVKQ